MHVLPAIGNFCGIFFKFSDRNRNFRTSSLLFFSIIVPLHGQGVERIRHIPCIAVQGRLDFVTPVRTAYDLHRAWSEMELRVVPVSDISVLSAQ